MPVPFDDHRMESNQCGAVAWLRFIEEQGGTGIRAALFQTSGVGEPLDFCFTRVNLRESLGQRGTVGTRTLASLAKSLFQSAASSPTLILGLADEVSPSLFTDDIRVRVPFCRIKNSGSLTHAPSEHGDPDNGRFEMLWLSEQPHGESLASRLLAEVMERRNPFEPFDLAEKALAVAFEDERLQAVMGIRGLVTVINLGLTACERPGEYADSPSPGGPGIRPKNQFLPLHGPMLTLAERLQSAALAAPGRYREVRIFS